MPIGVYRGNLPSAVEKAATEALTAVNAPVRSLLNQPSYESAS